MRMAGRTWTWGRVGVVVGVLYAFGLLPGGIILAYWGAFKGDEAQMIFGFTLMVGPLGLLLLAFLVGTSFEYFREMWQEFTPKKIEPSLEPWDALNRYADAAEQLGRPAELVERARELAREMKEEKSQGDDLYSDKGWIPMEKG